jgi:hypothetical protein
MPDVDWKLWGEVTALNILFRAMFVGRALTEPDPRKFVRDFTEGQIASMHAAGNQGEEFEEKVKSFTEAALRRMAHNVDLRLRSAESPEEENRR